MCYCFTISTCLIVTKTETINHVNEITLVYDFLGILLASSCIIENIKLIKKRLL